MGKNKLVLGTMTFGEQIFENDVIDIVKYFLDQGYNELDTAYVYNDGKSETLIGECLKKLQSYNIKISTKVNPRVTGRLDYESVMSQFNESLKRLGMESVYTLYLHFPDKNTDITEPLKACAKLYSEGKIKNIGLSNFPAWLVAEAYYICKKNGWIIPSVYEGMYNALSRNMEKELNEVLNKFEMSFYVYNPLAGGLLTNKYNSYEVLPNSGRFVNRPGYRNRYWKSSYFQAIDILKDVCNKYNIEIAAAAYAWLTNHSVLNKERGDAIILGFSNISQLKNNIKFSQGDPLNEKVILKFNEAWDIVKNDAPEYYRYIV